jgi:hypothetical protein
MNSRDWLAFVNDLGFKVVGWSFIYNDVDDLLIFDFTQN